MLDTEVTQIVNTEKITIRTLNNNRGGLIPFLPWGVIVELLLAPVATLRARFYFFDYHATVFTFPMSRASIPRDLLALRPCSAIKPVP